MITFIDDATGRARRVLAQVKCGKVKAGDNIRDLRGPLDREEAAISERRPRGSEDQAGRRVW